MNASRGEPRRPAGPSWLGLRPGTLLALVAIAILLVPLSALSQPADSSSPGGLLARLRARFGLSQANLGEVDPTSETMRFATLGLKNIAVTLLWDRANHYKKVEDWANLSATLEQMTKLQPNFYSVWDFQAHNLSYNISVEFDDYRDRYAWVMKGIEFLRQGISHNTREPRLLGRMGWFIGQKIGKSDEKAQFRRLFKADDDFHDRDDPDRTLPERDNWLVARGKYRAGQRLADSGATLKTTPLIFHSEPMMTAINYARALEEDGEFGPAAKDAWKLANEELGRFAERDIPTSWGVPIQLRLREAEEKRAGQLAEELEQLLPGQFAAVVESRRQALTAEQRTALDVPPLERTEAQHQLAAAATSQLAVTWKNVARQAPADVRERAEKLVREHTEAQERATMIDRYRDIVNFDFWKASCEAEITDAALRARAAVWRADREFDGARLQAAKQAYEEAFKAWREVLDESKVLREDQLTADDIAEVVDRYRKVLEQLDESFPSAFVLQDVLDRAGPRQ
ncbi:MAG: hypothetical protein K8S94_00800 [Planctomycetia bacterium]|nr:hypothetical protein [Planctomycetia bacterium]